VRGDAELFPVLFVDETSWATSTSCSGSGGPTDVLASRWTTSYRERAANPTKGGRGPGSPAEPSRPRSLWASRHLPQVGGAPALYHNVPSTTNSPSSSVHGASTLLVFDHEEAESGRGDETGNGRHGPFREGSNRGQ